MTAAGPRCRLRLGPHCRARAERARGCCPQSDAAAQCCLRCCKLLAWWRRAWRRQWRIRRARLDATTSRTFPLRHGPRTSQAWQRSLRRANLRPRQYHRRGIPRHACPRMAHRPPTGRVRGAPFGRDMLRHAARRHLHHRRSARVRPDHRPACRTPPGRHYPRRAATPHLRPPSPSPSNQTARASSFSRSSLCALFMATAGSSKGSSRRCSPTNTACRTRTA